MKIDNKFGSIWDELPDRTAKKIPETKEEALDLYIAAQSSVNKSTMKIWDAHNDMVKKSAELRKISERKKILENQVQKRLQENKERIIEDTRKDEERRKKFLEEQN